MAKFQMSPYEDVTAFIPARLGTGATSATRLADEDVGKFVKFVGDSRYALCDAGDPIGGQMQAVETATQDGYAIGTVNVGGRSLLSAICDGLQATAGTGTIAVGDYVVCGTVVAAGTALTTTTGPKVCKATVQPTAAGKSGVSTLAIPVSLADVTAAGDVLTTFTPGYNFKILSIAWAQGTPVTTASKLFNANLEIGTTNVTGGVVALTSATCTPLGKIIAGTAITALNTGGPTDTVSLEAADVTAFTEGSGYFLVTIQNMDTVGAVVQASNIPGMWRVVALGSAGAVGDTCIISRY